MRLFFALWPEAALARSLAAWALEAARATGGRIVDVEKIHLTLAFLGDALPDRVIAAANRVEAQAHAFAIERAGFWPHNRIVWVGPENTPGQLSDLARSLSQGKRPFAAHVTLLRKARPPSQLPPLPRLEWPVREFVLVRSALSAGGSSYEVLERFALRPSG